MAEHPDLSILPQLLMLLASSVLVVLLFRRLRLPPILGYLAVGMLLGPYALNFTSERRRADPGRPRRRVPGVHARAGVLAAAHDRHAARGVPHRRPAGGADDGGIRHGALGAAGAAADRGHDRRRARDVLDRHRDPPARRAGRAEPHAQPHRDRHPAVPGPGVRAAARARKRARRQRRRTRHVGDRRVDPAGGGRARAGAHLPALARAAAVPRDRPRAQHRAVHAGNADGRASARRGRRTRSACRSRSAGSSRACCSRKPSTGISSKPSSGRSATC